MPPATPKPTLILLVRHGRTPTTGKVLPGRAKGLSLSDAGRAEVDETARRIARIGGIDALYTSPMERAKETAAPIAGATGLRAKIDKRIVEIDIGEWTGMELKKVAKLPEWKWVQNAPSTFRFPGGESFFEMQSRLDDAVAAMAANHEGGIVVAVSHADPIKVAVVTALQAPLTSIHHIDIATASVTAIAVAGARRTVMTVGDLGSLEGIRG